ncbi:MAG: polysaccharide biosynthesis/export family protein [Candidatus Krumholzibacteriota bacterium]
MTGSRVEMMKRGNIRSISLLILGTALLAVLGGCGGSSTVARSNFVEFTPEQKQEIEAKASNEYRIQEGDQLRVAFSYEKDLSQDGVVVLNDGSITLMGVDRLEVAGRTITETDSLVTAAYAKDYVEPNLSIIVQETQGRRIYVLGEVMSPGIHTLPSGGIDMLGAVSVAGGFTDDAARSGAVLVRVTNEGYLVQEIDLSDFVSLASAGLATVQIQPFDVVYVPRSRIGDFAYFTEKVITGIAQITRIAVDLKYLTGGGVGRF